MVGNITRATGDVSDSAARAGHLLVAQDFAVEAGLACSGLAAAAVLGRLQRAVLFGTIERVFSADITIKQKRREHHVSSVNVEDGEW